MTKEIEVKVLEINKKEIIGKLKKLGAKKILDCRMRIKIFDFPDKRLSKNRSTVRIRKEGSYSTFAFKQIVSQRGAKICREIEMKIEDPKGMEEFLKAIGMIIISVHEKDRISYLFRGIEFSIDTWPSIPTYLEIEAKSMKKIKEGLMLLNIPEKRANSLDGLQLFKIYGLDISKTKSLVSRKIQN